MNLFKRIAALALGCALLASTALASPFAMDHQTESWLSEAGDVRFAVSAQFEELVPYGETTIGLFNDVLKHVSIASQISDAETTLEINVAGDPVIDLKETKAENGTELTTGLLKNRTLTSRASAMDALSGNAEEAKFDFFAAVSELEGCYQALTDAIIPYAEEKKASYTIKGVAPSKWSRIARLTPEQSQELAPLIAQVLGCGMDDAFRQQLAGATYAKGFIVGLYQTEQNGQDLAVYIKGDMTFEDGAKRALSYQWAFTTKESGERIDTFKFELKKAKAPKDDRIISASCKRTAADALKVKGESSARITDPEEGVTVTTTLTHDLSGKADGDDRTLTGSVSCAVRTAKGDKASTVTTTVKPELSLVSADGSGVLSGKARLEQKTGKDVTLSAVLTFDEEPAELIQSGEMYIVTEDMMPPSSLTQNLHADEPEDFLVGKPPIGYTAYTAPKSPVTVDLDTADESAMAVLMDEMSQNLAGKLLIALSKLPKEDAAILHDNLEDYAAFLALVEGL